MVRLGHLNSMVNNECAIVHPGIGLLAAPLKLQVYVIYKGLNITNLKLYNYLIILRTFYGFEL